MSSVKKVTLFITSLTGGGAEKVCVTIANGLVDKGWDVTLLTLNSNNDIYTTRLCSRIKKQTLGVSKARNSLFPLWNYISKNRPQKIIVFNYELSVLLVVVRKLSRFKPLIVSRNINTLSQVRRLEKSTWRKYFVTPMINYYYHQVDIIVNQCNEMKEDLVKSGRFKENKLKVIYNPISEEIEHYLKNRSSPIIKENYLLCIGRLEEQKGIHYAIRAFYEIHTIYPTLRLKIVGQGSLESSLKEYAKELGIIERIDFEGYQLCTIRYYEKARATILTSLYEGFPNVLIESIALGTPVVAFNCPSGPSEIVKNGINGYLVEHEDVSDLQGKIKLLLSDEIKEDIVKETAKKFTRSNVISAYERIIE